MLELELTVSFYRYAKNEFTGKVYNLKELDWYIPKKKKNIEALLEDLLSDTRNEKLEEPINPYFLSLKAELKRYIRLERNGEWPVLKTLEAVSVEGKYDSILPGVKKYYFWEKIGVKRIPVWFIPNH